MRDINRYTVALLLTGLAGIVESGIVRVTEVQWKPLLIVGALVVLFDVFPIRLPNGVLYSGGSAGLMYLLFKYGFETCELALVLGALASTLKAARGRVQDINWYRFGVTAGMYTASAAGALVTYYLSVSLPLFLRVLLVLGSFELVNILLFVGIRKSIGNHAYSWRQLFWAAGPPVLIFTIVLTRFLSIRDDALLAAEAAFTLIFLFVIYVFSVQYRKMADAYRDSEAKYRLIAENTLDVIVVLDAEGRVTYTSPSHLSVMGWGGADMYASRLMDAIHPEDQHLVASHLERLRASLKPFQAQFRYRHKDRGWIVVEGTGSPAVGLDERLDKVVMVMRDVTERVHTEELLRKSDKLAVVGQLAAGVAHELRNPLTAMKGFLQLMQDKVESGREYINIMLSEMKRIELIIGEFLILAKPHVVKFESKSPQELLQSVIALLDTQAILNNVQIVTNIGPGVPNILCEENQIKQVFINVLKNAIEAMPSGGQITIEMAYEPSNGVVIRFRDQGVGIPEESIPHLGEPFYTTKESGTGLGLMISYQIVQAHNGHMQIHSQVNQGTTVEVCLPAIV
jgi:PAS domain S-box-containing protein